MTSSCMNNRPVTVKCEYPCPVNELQEGKHYCLSYVEAPIIWKATKCWFEVPGFYLLNVKVRSFIMKETVYIGN
jgi:hypothetical protein